MLVVVAVLVVVILAIYRCLGFSTINDKTDNNDSDNNGGSSLPFPSVGPSAAKLFVWLWLLAF